MEAVLRSSPSPNLLLAIPERLRWEQSAATLLVPWNRFVRQVRSGGRFTVAVLAALLLLILAAPTYGEAPVSGSGTEANWGTVEKELLVNAAGTWPTTWAGAWRGADGALVLGFTDRPQDAVAQLLAGVGTPSVRVQGQLVQFSLGELLAVDQHLYDVATGPTGLQTVHAWSVRPERNRIVAYTRTPDWARGELVRAGVDVTKVEFAQPLGAVQYQSLACTRSNCVTEPTEGGLSWYSPLGTCTTGFGATRSGAQGFLSAGHCGGPGASVSLGRRPNGTKYGTVARSVQSASADGLFAQRSPDFPEGSRGTIYVSSADPQHAITAREPGSGYVNGEKTCFSGITSGAKCGTIADGSYTDTSLDLRDVVLTDTAACGAPGDSGSPYFDGDSTAQGILSGDLQNANQRCINGVYTKLSHVESALGASIILGG